MLSANLEGGTGELLSRGFFATTKKGIEESFREAVLRAIKRGVSNKDDTPPDPDRDSFRSTRCVEFPHDRCHVELDGMLGDPETRGDFFVGEAFG